jgi:ketosteroid isomerase-like protein
MSAVADQEEIAVARLESLTGHWHVEGEVQKSADGAAARWTSEERYDWLPGERFLVNRWDARVGEGDFQGMAVFGHDKDRGYFARFYDNAGNAPEYRVELDDTTLRIEGEAQRAVYELGELAMKIRWEWRDEQGWHALCTLTARKIPSASQVVRSYFEAFEARDRAAAERLLAEDFRFSSPRDDGIDRVGYFERCWPNSGELRAFRLERVCEHDGEVFVRYSAERAVDGVRFRNAELVRVSDGRIRAIEVYFGRNL